MNTIEEFKQSNPTLYEAFCNIQKEQLELFCRKNLDYGTDNIKAGTDLSTKESRDFAIQGIWFRTMDKMNRWKNIMFKKRGQDINFESLDDTYRDIINYATIAKMVADGKWVEGNGSKGSK